MSCPKCSGGDSCLCSIVGVGSVSVTGSGNGATDETAADPYIVSYEIVCEDIQDCADAVLDLQGFSYNDTNDEFENVGADGAVLMSDGLGEADFQIPSFGFTCEENQDCVAGILTTQGFTYNDGAARFDNAGAAGSLLTATGAGAAGFSLPEVDNSTADGRLTLTSGTSVTTADVVGAATLYYTPHIGNKITLYDGSVWVKHAFTERSIALTLTSGKPYDVFLYDNAGTLTLELLVWTNDTTRATAIVRQDGVWVKSGATTRRYLGTIYASGTNQCEDSDANRYVWNVNNRVRRRMFWKDNTVSWTYSSTTYRQTRGTAANKLQFVVGLSEDVVTAKASSVFGAGSDPFNSGIVGINLDTLNLATALIAGQYCGQYTGGCEAKWSGYSGVGKHTLIPGEANALASTLTYQGAGLTFIEGAIYA